MRLKGIIRAGALAAAASTISAGVASAADMPLYDAPGASYAEPQQPLEFGTGWYLRGDAAYAEEDHPAFDARTTSLDRKATDSGYAFGLGIGYKLTSFVRFDVTGDYLDPFDYSATASCGLGCDVSAKDYVWRWDGLANGYLDLGTWYGFTPYVGAGAGVAGTRQDTKLVVARTSAADAVTSAKQDDYRFAWAAMAGVSYAVTPHAMIDIGYRYLDLGRTRISLAPVATTQKDLASHQVRVGVEQIPLDVLPSGVMPDDLRVVARGCEEELERR